MLNKIININLTKSKSALHQLSWESHTQNSRKGAEIHTLYSHGHKTIALVKFNPDAKAEPHLHKSFESIFVIEGSYQDEFGTHEEGDLIIYPDNSIHSWCSPKGALLYVVWGDRVKQVN